MRQHNVRLQEEKSDMETLLTKLLYLVLLFGVVSAVILFMAATWAAAYFGFTAGG